MVTLCCLSKKKKIKYCKMKIVRMGFKQMGTVDTYTAIHHCYHGQVTAGTKPQPSAAINIDCPVQKQCKQFHNQQSSKYGNLLAQMSFFLFYFSREKLSNVMLCKLSGIWSWWDFSEIKKKKQPTGPSDVLKPQLGRQVHYKIVN